MTEQMSGPVSLTLTFFDPVLSGSPSAFSKVVPVSTASDYFSCRCSCRRVGSPRPTPATSEEEEERSFVGRKRGCFRFGGGHVPRLALARRVGGDGRLDVAAVRAAGAWADAPAVEFAMEAQQGPPKPATPAPRLHGVASGRGDPALARPGERAYVRAHCGNLLLSVRRARFAGKLQFVRSSTTNR